VANALTKTFQFLRTLRGLSIGRPCLTLKHADSLARRWLLKPLTGPSCCWRWIC